MAFMEVLQAATLILIITLLALVAKQKPTD